jgi:Domain of unknown function (DUF1905)
MKIFRDKQPIGQLEKRRGGYFYISISAEVVDRFKEKRKTRFLCTLEKKLTFQCGLNHLGDGNFFIILSGKNLKSIGKSLGEDLEFAIKEDPDPLGVKVPEVLEALLEQDDAIRSVYNKLSMGKKRHVIHTVSRIKDIDKQVSAALKLISTHVKPRQKRS